MHSCMLNFYTALDVPLLVLDFIILNQEHMSRLNVQNNTYVLKKKGNPDRKTFAM